jgi:acyl carrier protein
LGRKDEQIKLRGYRIEPGEVAAVLQGCEGVAEALVLLKELQGEPQLVAYYRGEASEESLKVHLSKHLPVYMHPAYYVRLEAFPINLNGKIDRKALPLPEQALQKHFALPKTWIEERLLALFAEVLEMEEEQISSTADFYDLGGNSIKLMKLASLINKTFDIQLSFRHLLEGKSVEGIRKRINSANKAAPQQAWYALNEGHEDMPMLFLLPPSNGEGLFYKAFAKQLEGKLWVLSTDYPKPDELGQHIDTLVLSERLATEIAARFSGERICYVGGYSFGFRVAYLIAQYLPLKIAELVNFDGIIYKNQEEEKLILKDLRALELAQGKELLSEEEEALYFRFENDYFVGALRCPVLHFRAKESILKAYDMRFVTEAENAFYWLEGTHDDLFERTENLKEMAEVLKNNFL